MNGAIPELDAVEARILGCLIEKQHTTPDSYPLTLNSLRLACNQSTNRDPVVDYDEELIFDTIQRLHRKELTRSASGHGSRSAKYRHLAGERLAIDDAGEAIIAVLLLRGPQTPGELKTRTERLHTFTELGELERVLDTLADAGYVERLERRPGEKQARWRELLTGGADEGQTNETPAVAPTTRAPDQAEEIAELKAAVARLEAEVAELRSRIG